MNRPRLQPDPAPVVDPARIGVSYSGAGNLFVVELGVAAAFIARGVRPSFIAGVSAGALTAVAHALDPEGGRGVDVAAASLGQITNRTFDLRWWQVLPRLVFGPRTSLGDNAPLAAIVGRELCQAFGLGPDPEIGAIGPPRVRIGAADRLSGEPVWFPPTQQLGAALLASSAIPGLFPWRTLEVEGRTRVLVDGGVVSNQPLSELVLEGCGTIFAVQVGSASGPQKTPTNLLDNAVGSFELAIHRTSTLEEAYVAMVLGDRGRVLHVRPLLDDPISGFDFTPELVARVVAEARRQTESWLSAEGF
ncbi:MAG: patatin-like phospholipase family protein [Candidatus Dormibacteraeota bacterium]|nr:patatin-like phospholipase family protein [Candidatus Dormibacteraeota bacterium]